jgi:glucokinase
MYYIGVDVGGMSIKCGIIGRNGEIVFKRAFKTDPYKPSEEILDDISAFVLQIIAEKNLSASDIDGMGLGFPGSVYDEKGIVRYCCNINLVNIEVVKRLERKTGIKNIKISNDANCAVLAETVFGAAKGAKNTVLITLGTGLGTGMVVDGKLLTGYRSAGAEGGHMQINMGGAVCGCGAKGHYEAYASATALIRQTDAAIKKNPDSLLAKIALERGVDGRTAFLAAAENDKTGKAVVAKYIKYVGQGLVNFANIFFPEVIIVGGGISNEGDTIIKPLQRYVSRNIYGAQYNPKIKVVAATLKNDAGIIGAATLSME